MATTDSNTTSQSNQGEQKTPTLATQSTKPAAKKTAAKPTTTKTGTAKPAAKKTAVKTTVAKTTTTPKTTKLATKKTVAKPSATAKTTTTTGTARAATKTTTTKSTTSKNSNDINNMFGTISKRYDILNHVLSFGIDYWWRHRLVNSIIPGAKARVLDVAAGTLDVGLAIVRKYPQVTVVAGDICEPMLQYGENKIRSVEKDRIKCEVMDAHKIPHADESFDAVTIAFGIRNMKDRLKALKEMNRVLVNGGQLCILEFSPLTTPYLGKAYHYYLGNIMPKIAKLFGQQEEAYQHLAETVKEFPSPQDFCHEIKKAGFTFIRHENLSFGIATLYVAIKT